MFFVPCLHIYISSIEWLLKKTSSNIVPSIQPAFSPLKFPQVTTHPELIAWSCLDNHGLTDVSERGPVRSWFFHLLGTGGVRWIGLHPCLSKPDHSGRMRGILGPTNQRIGSTDEDRVTISPLQVVFFRIIGRIRGAFWDPQKSRFCFRREAFEILKARDRAP